MNELQPHKIAFYKVYNGCYQEVLSTILHHPTYQEANPCQLKHVQPRSISSFQLPFEQAELVLGLLGNLGVVYMVHASPEEIFFIENFCLPFVQIVDRPVFLCK